ncbi:hypothetical protein L3X38_002880 [Prunus dulcis]|uniref:Reverse transcriptase domain-containing protein n=2 Tax=Prunus dulcis TaxID=3755 RepID=A0AAD4ZL54_PRUDU|nr:hypothetical protein L3X38_002880 [Prunus dulcis]
MNKAYDRVEWDFLEAVMLKMGFAESWVNLIMSCVRSVELSVLINGQPGRKFKPSKGLRQGDPILPYLFLIVSDVLSLLIQSAVSNELLQGIKMGNRAPTLSHLMFADDTLIFLKASTQNCKNLVMLLNAYCYASGHQVNFSKSTLFLSPHTPMQLRESLCNIFGMPEVEDPRNYLGLPTVLGRAKKNTLFYIKERILCKVDGWKQQLLSQAGREVLIKAVAQAVPTYPMNIFLLPLTFCKEIDSILARFWWGQTGDRRRVNGMSWESFGNSRRDGGLGFRNTYEFNLALIAKQCWRLVHDPDSLWAQTLKARYFPNTTFLEAKKGGRAS